MSLSIGKLVKASADHEESMLRVKAVARATVQEYHALSAAALQASTTTRHSLSSIGEGMKFLAMAGFQAKEIAEMIPVVTRMATAGAVDMVTAADITTNILAGYGMAIEDLSKATDVLVAAFTGANVNLQLLGETFKYVGPVAKSAGMEFEEITAAAALLGNAGIQGSIAGTSLKSAISRLISPSNTAARILKRLGVETTTSEGKLRSLADIIDDLSKAGATAADVMRIFGLRAGPSMARLLDVGADALRQYTQRLRDSEGWAELIEAEQMQSFNAQFDLTKNIIHAFSVELGDVLLPYMKTLNWLIGDLVGSWRGLDDAMKDNVIRVAVVGGAILSFITVLGLVAGAISMVIKGFTTLGIILGLVTSGPVLAILGIALAIGYLKKAWDENLGGIQDKTRQVVESILAQWNELTTWWETSDFGQAVRDAWADIVAVWTSDELTLPQKVIETVSIVANTIADLIPSIRAIWDVWTDDDLSLAEKTLATVSIITRSVSGLIESITTWWINTTVTLAEKVVTILGLNPDENAFVGFLRQLQTIWNNEELTLGEKVIESLNLIPGAQALQTFYQKLSEIWANDQLTFGTKVVDTIELLADTAIVKIALAILAGVAAWKILPAVYSALSAAITLGAGKLAAGGLVLGKIAIASVLLVLGAGAIGWVFGDKEGRDAWVEAIKESIRQIDLGEPITVPIALMDILRLTFDFGTEGLRKARAKVAELREELLLWEPGVTEAPEWLPDLAKSALELGISLAKLVGEGFLLLFDISQLIGVAIAKGTVAAIKSIINFGKELGRAFVDAIVGILPGWLKGWLGIETTQPISKLPEEEELKQAIGLDSLEVEVEPIPVLESVTQFAKELAGMYPQYGWPHIEDVALEKAFQILDSPTAVYEIMNVVDSFISETERIENAIDELSREMGIDLRSIPVEDISKLVALLQNEYESIFEDIAEYHGISLIGLVKQLINDEAVDKTIPTGTEEFVSYLEVEVEPVPVGIDKFVSYLEDKLSQMKLPIDWRFLAAQWGLETGWGKSLSAPFNLAGIKGTGPAGSVTQLTREVINGKEVVVEAQFAAFNNIEEFIDAYLKLLETSYPLALKARSIEDFVAGLFSGVGGRRYATDPKYADLVVGTYSSILKRGFAEGGYTGNRPVDEVVGVVHGQEIVIPAYAVRKGMTGILEFLGVPGFQEGRVPSIPGVSQARATLSWMRDIFNDIADVLLEGLATLFEYIIRAIEVIALALVGEEKVEKIKAEFQSFYEGITDWVQKMKVTTPPTPPEPEEGEKVDIKWWQEWLADLEAAMEEFDWSSPINNFVNTLANGLAQAESYMAQFASEIVRLIKHVVQETEDGTRQIVFDFDNMIAQMANSLATMLAEAFTNLLSGYDIPQQRKDLFPNLTELLDNLENYAKNQERLQKLVMASDLATIGGAGAGAFIGSVFGPLGTLIGGFLGGLAGRKSAQAATKREIEELTEKLKTDFLAIQEMLGTTMQDVANALGRAFSADTYEDFVNQFSQNLEDQVRNALITAFMSSDIVRPWIEQLTQEMSWAVLDLKLDDAERDTILDLMSKITDASKDFYEMLKELGIATGDVADGMKELSGAMRNVPQGLKIVSNRLAAAGYSVPGLHTMAYEEPNDRVTEPKMEIHIHGSIYGVDELKRVIKTTVAETQRRVSLATNGVG